MKITIDSIKKTILLAGGLFLSVLSVNADGNMPSGLTPEMLRPQFSNLTPEAASLGRYGAFQVSEYSGAANISIPLYTVKSGDVSFPITLYYDATGIKVEQDATMVGLGWNLSYGGMISHIICGEDDFLENTGREVDLDWITNWWKKKEKNIKTGIPKDIPFLLENYPKTVDFSNVLVSSKMSGKMILEGVKEMELYERMSKGYDTPDIYQASFCGHNISFTIDRRKGGANGPYPIIILNNNPRKYKISYKTGDTNEVQNTYLGYPTSFVITDDKGYSYCFKGYRENIILDLGVGGGHGIDSYYLTMIYGPDGENGKSVVKFYYDNPVLLTFKGSRVTAKSHKPKVEQNDATPNTTDGGNAYRNLFKPNSYSVSVGCYDEDGRCKRIYPTKITTALETIEFIKGKRLDIKDEHAKCISGIKIKSITGNSQKEISFTYDIFSEATGSYKRLKLTNVKIDDKKYNFEYDTRKLPSVASYSKDYWGYYNGASNGNEFVGCSPAYEISNGVVKEVEHLDGSNRLASEELCKVGMLKKVTYPTGGYTLYEFEANRFNDRYYYPDAKNSKLSLSYLYNDNDKQLTIASNCNLGPNSTRLPITTTHKNDELTIWAHLYGSSDNFTVTIKDEDGNQKWTHTYYYNKINNTNGYTDFNETIKLEELQRLYGLNVGTNYTIEGKINAAISSGNKTSGGFGYKPYVQKTYVQKPTASPTTKNENGGYSIGGGVRVKTIKNYDSDGKYLNGVKYEYSGGKLLSPTVRLETHYVSCNYDATPLGIHYSFNYVNTEPSYQYICSLDIPATVGYDSVVKNEVDESEKVIYRKTVFDFHNYGYDSTCPAEQLNLLTQGAFYSTSSLGHLNGMIKNESVYNGSVLASTTQYDYGSMPIDTIYYQKCLPLHLPSIEKTVVNYNQTFFRKCNTWTYLTSKTETLYDSKGNKTTSNTTSFQYNPTNYQLSDLSVTDGTNTSRTHYYYPSDKKVAGYQCLNDAHKISELTAIDTYRNENYAGGSMFNYCKWKNTNLPVVNECYSITPSKAKILDMKVDPSNGYDNYGNIRQYTKKDGTDVTIIWSYNHQLPIMEIVGSTYTEVCNKAKNVKNISSLENASFVSETTMSSIHATLRKDLPNALVTAYTYSPWLSVSQIIKPNGEKTAYSYDSYGRLSTVLDANQSTFQPLQIYNYNYKK